VPRCAPRKAAHNRQYSACLCHAIEWRQSGLLHVSLLTICGEGAGKSIPVEEQPCSRQKVRAMSCRCTFHHPSTFAKLMSSGVAFLGSTIRPSATRPSSCHRRNDPAGPARPYAPCAPHVPNSISSESEWASHSFRRSVILRMGDSSSLMAISCLGGARQCGRFGSETWKPQGSLQRLWGDDLYLSHALPAIVVASLVPDRGATTSERPTGLRQGLIHHRHLAIRLRVGSRHRICWNGSCRIVARPNGRFIRSNGKEADDGKQCGKQGGHWSRSCRWPSLGLCASRAAGGANRDRRLAVGISNEMSGISHFIGRHSIWRGL